MGELLDGRRIAAGQVSAPLLEDRRLISRVLRHVTDIAAGRRLPRLNDVDPWMVGDDWASSALIRVKQPYDRSVFVVVGDKLAPRPGIVLDHAPISTCPATTLLGVTLSFVPQAMEGRTALAVEGATVHLDAPILYRSLLVPLSEDGRKIDAMLIAASFREVREGEDCHAPSRITWCRSFSASPVGAPRIA
jgi:hypothetical protein